MKASRWLVWLSLGFALCLANCGMTTAKLADKPSSTATPVAPIATSLSAPLPTPVSTPNASQLAACGMTDPTSVWRLGDLLITPQDFFGDQARKLPDGTPLAPFHMSVPTDGDLSNSTLPAANPEVNPNLKSGYLFKVCNSSPLQAHVLNSVSVRIESATQYSGQLNSWNPCDGPYDASKKTSGGGCGGGFCVNETLKATFDATVPNANATVTQVGWASGDCPGYVEGPLPVSLKPQSTVSMDVAVTLPPAQGVYTFAFGLAQDASATTFLPATQPILLAPVAHQWTGEACLQPAMQSQIPSASSPTYYICPAS